LELDISLIIEENKLLLKNKIVGCIYIKKQNVFQLPFPTYPFPIIGTQHIKISILKKGFR
jgi:hypothetical protein